MASTDGPPWSSLTVNVTALTVAHNGPKYSLDRHIGCHHRIAELQQEVGMSWKKPVIVEIALGAEINSYSSAGRK